MTPETVSLAEWVAPVVVTALVSGAVQGLVTYGAIKVKFDWLFSRLDKVERAVDDEAEKINARIDRALERSHVGRATDARP